LGKTVEWLIAAAFVLFVLAVLAAAALEAFLWLRERLRRGSPPPGRVRLLYRRVLLGIAGAGVLCMLWARFVEPNWPEVTHVRIESRKVPAGARPVRIVHLSDFHCEREPRLEERLPALVGAEKPDFIVFTGDCINTPWGLPVLHRTLKALAGVAPTFVVGGNWDAWYFTGLDRFGGTGVQALDGRHVRLLAGGTPVNVAGVHFGHEEGLAGAVRGIPPSELSVFLYHMPDLAYDLEKSGVDLALVGHTHGGQVRLPFYGALITLSGFGKRFEAGLYELGGMRMYVNRGIGCEGHGLPPLRFLCRPEITVIDIAPGTPVKRE
jgi:hypothetical protein